MSGKEISQGYKHTEVGAIPQDWNVQPLVSLAEIRSGIAKNSNVTVSDPILVHYLRVANVQDGFLDLSEMSQLQISRSDIARYAVLPGDMLMNEGGDLDKLGRGALWNGEFEPCIHQNHVFVVRCNPKIFPSYLNCWTRTSAARRYFLLAGRQTTNLASINKTSLGQLPVALPASRKEQEAIAQALSDTDALIESLEQLIAKKRLIKQGAMQELLTGKRRLPGFTNTWNTVKLIDCLLAPPDYGINAAGVQRNTTLPTYIRITDINDDGQLIKDQLVSVNHPQSMDYTLHENEIVFARTGASVGKTYLYQPSDGGLVFAGFLIRARVNSQKLYPAFLAEFTKTNQYWNWVRVMSMRSGQPGINGQEYSQLELKLPPLSEQEAIATILSDMDTEISALEERLAKTHQIKQGMMHELLSGRIRLLEGQRNEP